MPGMVVFRRRWSVGSDDMVVPAVLLLILHTAWLIILAVIFGVSTFDPTRRCSVDLQIHILGYIVVMGACLLLEVVVAIVSMRGSILEMTPRVSMQYLLYARLVVCVGEVTWLVLSIKWLVQNYYSCHQDMLARDAVLGVNIFQICMMILSMITLCCAFDTAGRKWVKMKKYQESMKEKTHRSRRSGSARRNWRQRKAFRAYEESWDRRLQLMCCCVERKGRNKNSMSEIAQLFTEFFRDLDVVPSDVIAGLVLLRRYQKLRMQHYCQLDNNDTYRYLSGIPVTPRTQFLQLSQPEVLQQYQLVLHYMKFAMAAYGWPIFMMMNTGTGLCKLMPYLSCCCCCKSCCSKKVDPSDPVVSDNCCECNLAALRKIGGLKNTDLIYVTYHVDIGETPFYVALDNKYNKVVICVRGTLSLQDVLTDLKADAETLPLDPVKEDWIGHKGMVQAAIYIKKKLKEDHILTKAFEKCKEKSSEKYGLVLVGHSLGAGTAAILAIMLQQEYTDLHCYSYSPPGGLLSYECVEETKSFITSVVIGKDVVPRIGLPQMELLRTDLINIIKKSKNAKWKIIIKALCCGSESASQITYEEVKADVERDATAHPSDQEIGLTAHKLMYPPGKIILVVRNHSSRDKSLCCGSKEPVYQAIWADNSDFQEVLVSPTMVNDHMPDNVMEALQKVLVNVAPPKPTRLLTETERKALLTHDLSPGTPVSPASQKIPMFESGTSTLNNAPDLYNVHWDMLNEDILLSLEKESLFPELYELPRLELDLDTSWISAPLASPENLSVSSSAMSLENALKNKCVSSTSVRLETIQQSPDVAVKIDTPLKSSLDDESVAKSGAVIVDINTSSDTANVNDSEIVKDESQLKTYNDDELSAIKVNGSPKISVIHKQTSNHSQESNSCSVQMDKDNHSNYTSPILHSSPFNHSENTFQAECDTPLLDRHSPIENSLNGHLHPTNIRSPVYTQNSQENLGRRKPSPRRTLSPKVPSPANKRLHYSQSESYIETLSDKYQMKRSKEQGDIAHLRDTTKVFEANSSKSQEKLLKPRESEPIFEESKLPQVHSAILESGYKETEDNGGALMVVAEDELDDSYLEIQKDMSRETDCLLPQLELPESVEAEFREFNESILNQTESLESTTTLTTNSESSESKATVVSAHFDNSPNGEELPSGEDDVLGVKENESHDLLVLGHDQCEDLPAVEVYEPLVTSVDSLLESESMDDMYSKTTRLSVSEGTYSGSEKRSSSSGQSTSGHSISGHSDEYPMIETDV